MHKINENTHTEYTEIRSEINRNREFENNNNPERN